MWATSPRERRPAGVVLQVGHRGDAQPAALPDALLRLDA
jgi:hypothetical protein